MATPVVSKSAGILGLLLTLLLIAGVAGAALMGFVGWISVPQGHFVVLLKKTGQDLTNEQLLASGPEFKGLQPEILREGYHFCNPYSWWSSEPIAATVIPDMQVGVLTRKFGNPLPPGQVLAETEEEKGVTRQLLLPGRHYINSYAYRVETAPMVSIQPGFVGVVTLLVGRMPAVANTFVVKEGERGTQPFLLPPGTHPQYSNRWIYKVVPIDMRSQKLEMAGENSVFFLSKDGFPVHTEGTIEYALDPKKLAEMFVMFVDDKDLEVSGGLKNIETKLILPFGRSLYRIYGAQHKAVDYLIGSTRVVVQNQVESELRSSCAREGVQIKSFVIRSTDPPMAIRQQYERREIAKRQKEQFTAEIATEIGQPQLAEGKVMLDPAGNALYEGGRLAKEIQTRMKDRAEKTGAVRLDVANEKRKAEQYAKVELTKAAQRLEVTRLGLQAADDLAASKIAGGKAEALVIGYKNQAQVAGVEATVTAFGSGEKYARYLMAGKMAPAIHNIWSNTDGFFAELFRGLSASPAHGAAPSAGHGEK